MRTFRWLLICALLFLVSATQLSAQSNLIIDSVFAGVSFDRIVVEDYAVADDGVYLAFKMSRKGAIQKKMGAVGSGGGDWTNLPAIALVKLSPDMKLISEEMHFFKKSGMGKVAYLSEPIVRGKIKTLAAPEKILSAQQAAQKLASFIPETSAAPTANSTTKTETPDVPHYQMNMQFGGVGIKGVKVKNMEPGQYGFTKKSVQEYPIGRAELGLEENESLFYGTAGMLMAEDKIRGNSFGLFGIKVKKDKTDHQYFNHLLYTVGPDGKTQAQRLKTDKPLVAAQVFPIYADENQNPQPVDRILFVQREVKRKSNSSPNKLNRRVVLIDGEGKLLQDSKFPMLNQHNNWAKVTPMANNRLLLITSGNSPRGMAYYILGPDKMEYSEMIDSKHPLFKQFNFVQGPLPGYAFSPKGQVDYPDGSVLFSDELETAGTNSAGARVTRRTGRIHMKFDANGKLINMLRVPRRKAKNGFLKHLEESDDVHIYLDLAELSLKNATGEVIFEATNGVLNHVDKNALTLDQTVLEANGLKLFDIMKIDREARTFYLLFKNKLQASEFTVKKFSY
ncbi:MAG: hypothetical protein AAFV95_28995 [Bacteroidota bacterium]